VPPPVPIRVTGVVEPVAGAPVAGAGVAAAGACGPRVGACDETGAACAPEAGRAAVVEERVPERDPVVVDREPADGPDTASVSPTERVESEPAGAGAIRAAA
jgi:hypothetical protein